MFKFEVGKDYTQGDAYSRKFVRFRCVHVDEELVIFIYSHRGRNRPYHIYLADTKLEMWDYYDRKVAA